MKIEFSSDEVESILKEFVSVAYGIPAKDVTTAFVLDKNGSVASCGGAEVYVNTKAARPEGWQSYTYRDLVKE